MLDRSGIRQSLALKLYQHKQIWYAIKEMNRANYTIPSPTHQCLGEPHCLFELGRPGWMIDFIVDNAGTERDRGGAAPEVE